MSTSTITVPPEQILDLELPVNQANAATVREYLKSLLAAVWNQGPDFNPKRPWGLPAWRIPIEEALVRDGLVAGSLDSWGLLIGRVDDREVDTLIRSAIEAL